MEKLKQIKETDVYYVVMNAMDIYQFNKRLYYPLIKYPAEVILWFDKIINKIYIENFVPQDRRRFFEKDIKTRFTNLKIRSRIRSLGSNNINKLIAFKGIVIRCSVIYPEMKDAYFRCSCNYVETKMVIRGRVETPDSCKNCEKKGSMEIIHNLCTFADKQFIKLQERPDEIPEGETPTNVNLIVYDDLVDECKPGDAVEIIGIYRAQPLRVSRNRRELKSIFNCYVEAISICFNYQNKVVINNEVMKESEKILFTKEEVRKFKKLSKKRTVYDDLVKSFAPSLY